MSCGLICGPDFAQQLNLAAAVADAHETEEQMTKEGPMRISSICAANFKSLVDFTVTLPKFSCLIGLNGAGKSTVLHFLDFIAQQVRGDIKRWLSDAAGGQTRLSSRLGPKKNIEFEVSLVTDEGVGGVLWKGTFNAGSLSCTAEHIETPGATLDVDRGHMKIVQVDPNDKKQGGLLDEDISFSYQGSVLSQLKTERLPQSLVGSIGCRTEPSRRT